MICLAALQPIARWLGWESGAPFSEASTLAFLALTMTSFGYAYTDARITSDTSLTIVAGNRVQLVPYNQFSLWNKYQFNPTWAAALGVIHFSDWFASSDDTVRLPGFWRVDAGLYAKIDEMWKVQLNVENIFNRGYWATADGNNNISPGQPRTFRVMAIAKF